MVFTLAPVILSAGIGYVLLDYGVIAALHNVVERQRMQTIPIQDLRLLLLDTLAPVDEFVDGADATRSSEYRALRNLINTNFSNVERTLQSTPWSIEPLKRAREDWAAAADEADKLLSIPIRAEDRGALEILKRFHGRISSANDKLAAVHQKLFDKIEQDHDSAVLFYERSLLIAGIIAGISLFMVMGGIFLVDRMITSSIGRLVNGAEKFASGDRDYRIKIDVPPELKRVAEEFNLMITRIHDYEATLAELAHRDSLTHLPNRRAFDDALNADFTGIEQMGDPCALLVLDIDFFKYINDTHGHSAGDAVLQEIGLVLTKQLRPSDILYRVGGEEFSVLLEGTNLTSAIAIAERLRVAVESHDFEFKDTRIGVTVSIGVATTNDNCDRAGLMEAADTSLYEAKRAGRNRVVASQESRLDADRHGN